MEAAINIASMPWYEREQLLTKKDREAIEKAKASQWEEIDENWAESEAGRFEIRRIIRSERLRDEAICGMI